MMATSDGKRCFRILACDGVAEDGLATLREVADIDCRPKITSDELLEIIPSYDGLIVRSATKVTRQVIDKGTRLKVIGRAGVGVDNVCVDAATARGIFVVNSPQGNTIAAAELTVGLILSVARRLPAAVSSVSRGEWKRSLFVGTQVHAKTLGIIGLGQVGSHVARVCGALGMRLLGFDPFVNEEKCRQLNVETVSLERLLVDSDVVTLHIPLFEGTRHLLGEEQFKKMKPTAFIINTSRGGVVDEAALARALSAGWISGAALDVFEVEGAMDDNNELIKLQKSGKNIVLTPHIGASTVEAQQSVAVDVAFQIRETLLGNLPKSAVNLPYINVADMPQKFQLVRSAEILGRLASSLPTSAVEKLSVSIAGDAKPEDEELLLLSVAKGLLAPRCSNRVNFVNVRMISAALRVQLSVSRVSTTGAFWYVEVVVKGGGVVRSLIGQIHPEHGSLLITRFLGTSIFMKMPKIGFVSDSGMGDDTPINPIKKGDEGWSPIFMFYTIHQDEPGVLADIMSNLSSRRINLASCHLGRRHLPHPSVDGSPKNILPADETAKALDAPNIHIINNTTNIDIKKGFDDNENRGDKEDTTATSCNSDIGKDDGDTEGWPNSGKRVYSRESIDTIKNININDDKNINSTNIGVCIFHTDEQISESLLDEIRCKPFVIEAKLLATPHTLGQIHSS